MHTQKQTALNYLDELNYSVVSQSDNTYELKQNRTGLEVELDFSVLGKGILPSDITPKKDKKLVFFDISDIDSIGIDALEVHASQYGEHCSLVVIEDAFFEQTMKEIWMFLANDPRERDVFNDSRFYKP
ncbi:hypothetical protein [Thaumasiovibrio sp. DFM-14]|uniref:hypothetical protein n=1 Tax=Thaumasiovibrio sp. DFM-14 TaxID=3384792 RepID=UPI0039A01A5E